MQTNGPTSLPHRLQAKRTGMVIPKGMPRLQPRQQPGGRAGMPQIPPGGMPQMPPGGMPQMPQTPGAMPQMPQMPGGMPQMPGRQLAEPGLDFES